MSLIDWLIVGFTAVMAAIGWRQGFLAGALALAGFTGGAFLGSRLGPALLPGGSSSVYAPLVALVAALAGGSILAGALEGAGFVLRRAIPIPGVAALDGLLGALLSAAVGLGLAWLAGAVMLQTPGARHLRTDIQRSAILSRLNAVLPPSGSVLHLLARFDPFPHIDGPEADVPAPAPAVARDPQVRAAAASVVRVLGTACGLGIEGSGWVAGDGIVVTNAHVVAGEDDTVVQERGTGPRLQARAVAFDATNDVAVLRVEGLHAPALALDADPASGRSGAILGFPQNGPYDVRAGRLGQTRTVLSQDAYGNGPVSRRMTPFRGRVRPGNSGGPLVGTDGRVLTTVFAQARGSTRQGGYGVPNAVVRDVLDGAAGGGSVSTGRCAG
ncbi:MarP family serine protease [Baekduia soli]|uniref:MarP family serine protease n=1 Tax=Baekduia soli TaxID=496014 RepID=A0A5B8UB25_9ACTN|nr:MarP family serine protease [Baekduia soli]QEC50018.1 MarP family serine protease [Baekduia soli]